jgi:hypothetical protein
MGLFWFFFWSRAVMRDILADNSCNSRFGGFNSRLAPHEFPFCVLRELTGRRLIYLIFFGAEVALFEHSWKNSPFPREKQGTLRSHTVAPTARGSAS